MLVFGLLSLNYLTGYDVVACSKLSFQRFFFHVLLLGLNVFTILRSPKTIED